MRMKEFLVLLVKFLRIQSFHQIPENHTMLLENNNNLQDSANMEFWNKNLQLLSGKTLKVVFMTSPRETEEMAGGTYQFENGTSIFLEGSSIPVVYELRESLNLTFEVHFADNYDAAWDMVAKGDVELGTPLRTVQLHLTTKGAINTVAFMHPMLSMSSNVYFRQPPMGSINNIIFGPLRNDAWFLLLTCWTICILGCCIIRYFSGSRGKFSYSDIVVWAVAVINGRDYPVYDSEMKHMRLSLRIAMFSTMCLSVIALAIYTAKIVAFFSIKSHAVKSPEDLLKYKYTLSSFSHIHVDRIFKNSENKHRLMEISIRNFKSGEDSMMKLVNPRNPDPRYAFLTHPDGFYMYGVFYNNYTTELCGISSFASTIRSARSMYVKKNSPFREILNWKIVQTVEYGINHRHQINHKRKYEYRCCSNSNKQGFEELSLQHTSVAFVILIAGASAALLIECVVFASRLFESFANPYPWYRLERREEVSQEYSTSFEQCGWC